MTFASFVNNTAPLSYRPPERQRTKTTASGIVFGAAHYWRGFPGWTVYPTHFAPENPDYVFGNWVSPQGRPYIDGAFPASDLSLEPFE